MKRKVIFNIVLFTIAVIGFAETKMQKQLLKEYDHIFMRVKYANQVGFCFDGMNKIPEEKIKGSEHSFFIENQNIYIKVFNKEKNKYFYTRCFDFTSNLGKLAISQNYQVYPSARLDGHWNFFKLGNNLNITVCTGSTCKNTKIALYEITGIPLSITDGIFYEFNETNIKEAKNFKLSLNSKGMSKIDINQEKQKMKNLFNKMNNHFTKKEVDKKRKFFEKLLN